MCDVHCDKREKMSFMFNEREREREYEMNPTTHLNTALCCRAVLYSMIRETMPLLNERVVVKTGPIRRTCTCMCVRGVCIIRTRALYMDDSTTSANNRNTTTPLSHTYEQVPQRAWASLHRTYGPACGHIARLSIHECVEVDLRLEQYAHLKRPAVVRTASAAANGV